MRIIQYLFQMLPHIQYNTVRGGKVKAFYRILEQYGFQFPNDEEKGVVEGTSDLYAKKEGTK